MKVTYTLREVCSWSVVASARLRNVVEHRYVDISYEKADGSSQVQTIELPTTEAVHLCSSMATDVTLQAVIKESHNKWWSPAGECSLPGLMQLISAAASKGTKWLNRIDCKYIDIRIDMRSGHFIMRNNQGVEASKDIFSMLDWPQGVQPESKSND